MKLATIILFIGISCYFYSTTEITKTNISNINSEEFYPIAYEDGILYASKPKSGYNRFATKENVYKIYYSKIIDGHELTTPIRIKIKKKTAKKLLSISHKIPSSFIKETGEFLFMSNNTEKTLRHNTAIFKGEIKNLELINIEMLNICDPNFDYLHPTVSANGLKMILSSNQGISNAYQLYLYERTDLESDWNLTRSIEEINFSKFISYPNLVSDSLLIYSAREENSKHFDIFSSRLNSQGKWGEPINLQNLNSEFDELGLIQIGERNGYFTSNRDGYDQIFYFEKK